MASFKFGIILLLVAAVTVATLGSPVMETQTGISSESQELRELEPNPNDYDEELEPNPRDYDEELIPNPNDYDDELEPNPSDYDDELEPNPNDYDEELEPNPRDYDEELIPNPNDYDDELEPNPSDYDDELEPNPSDYDDELEPNPSDYDEELEPNPSDYDEELKPNPSDYDEELEPNQNDTDGKEEDEFSKRGVPSPGTVIAVAEFGIGVLKDILHVIGSINRKIAIGVENKSGFKWEALNVYFRYGTSDVIPPHDVQSGKALLYDARKTSGPTATGAVGVVTYYIPRLRQTLAFLFSVPYNYHWYSNWWDVRCYSGKRYANYRLYKKMYYGKPIKGNNRWYRRYLGSGLRMKGVMNSSGSAILGVRVYRNRKG